MDLLHHSGLLNPETTLVVLVDYVAGLGSLELIDAKLGEVEGLLERLLKLAAVKPFLECGSRGGGTGEAVLLETSGVNGGLSGLRGGESSGTGRSWPDPRHLLQ